MAAHRLKTKKKKGWRVLFLFLILIVLVWLTSFGIIRSRCKITCKGFEGLQTDAYTEEEKVWISMSLSYLVYGCEACDHETGLVEDIIDPDKMGIIRENADILRKDPSDPASAYIDSADFIRQHTGSFRYLSELRDEKSSFYGVAFADDEKKVVWVSYSGSVSFMDALQSLKLAIGPSLSEQERDAFVFYESVLSLVEVKEKGYSLVLCGHSLGGALASMVSFLSDCPAITINGADGLALDKIEGIAGEKLTADKISNYMVSPNNGKFSFRDLIQRLMFLGSYDQVDCHIYQDNGMADNTHGVFGFVLFEDGDLTKPYLPAEEVR